MDSFIKEVKSQLYERIGNPFVGCFLVSWGLWNWNIVLGILFANGFEGKHQAVIQSIEQSGTWYAKLWLLPALSALAYIVLYPWLAKAVFWYWENRQKELKRLRQEIEDETPITQDEAFRLRRANREEIRQLEGQLSELEKRNQELLFSLNEKERQLLEREQSVLDQNLQLNGIAKEMNSESVPESESVLDGNSNDHKPLLERFKDEAINKAKAYLSIQNDNILIPFFALIEGDGVSASKLAERAGVNRIIIDHGLKQLEQIGAVNYYGGTWYLSDYGKQVTIDSELVGI